MVAYPIRIPRRHYGGSKEAPRRKTAEYNRMAKQIEDYLNKKMAERDDEIQVYIYGFVAADLGLREEDVKKFLYGLAAGQGGLSIRKRPPSPP